ncbi:DUF305 domain-containing protein [Sphaerisporangium perillae]|uniref:DUF305 domain-containing protein n=1 Tax=Sphaerisporangium perillae TaxID=2935860 RepID=UPI00200BB459|nr:DUF305 domain-containing protein [Sphaerisporangium perillae]
MTRAAPPHAGRRGRTRRAHAKRRLAAIVVAALLLSGCASQNAEPVDADDVMFLQMMIPHHRQAIEIAALAEAKAADPTLRTLAAAIKVTQDSEVRRMTAWLHSWDQPLAAPADAHAHHGGMPETDRRQIALLRNATDFDRDALNLLIAHQDDAVQMATGEIRNGANQQVKQWAEQVEQSRKAQIDQMLHLLDQGTPDPG